MYRFAGHLGRRDLRPFRAGDRGSGQGYCWPSDCVAVDVAVAVGLLAVAVGLLAVEVEVGERRGRSLAVLPVPNWPGLLGRIASAVGRGLMTGAPPAEALPAPAPP